MRKANHPPSDNAKKNTMSAPNNLTKQVQLPAKPPPSFPIDKGHTNRSAAKSYLMTSNSGPALRVPDTRANSTRDSTSSKLAHFDKVQTLNGQFTLHDISNAIKRSVGHQDNEGNSSPNGSIDQLKIDIHEAIFSYVQSVATRNVQGEFPNFNPYLSTDSLKIYFGTVVQHINNVLIPQNSSVVFKLYDETTNTYQQMKEYISVQGSRARLEGTNNLGDEDYDTLPLTRDGHEVFYMDPQTNPDTMLTEPLKQKKASMLSVCSEMFKRGDYWELLASTMKMGEWCNQVNACKWKIMKVGYGNNCEERME